MMDTHARVLPGAFGNLASGGANALAADAEPLLSAGGGLRIGSGTSTAAGPAAGDSDPALLSGGSWSIDSAPIASSGSNPAAADAPAPAAGPGFGGAGAAGPLAEGLFSTPLEALVSAAMPTMAPAAPQSYEGGGWAAPVAAGHQLPHQQLMFVGGYQLCEAPAVPPQHTLAQVLLMQQPEQQLPRQEQQQLQQQRQRPAPELASQSRPPRLTLNLPTAVAAGLITHLPSLQLLCDCVFGIQGGGAPDTVKLVVTGALPNLHNARALVSRLLQSPPAPRWWLRGEWAAARSALAPSHAVATVRAHATLNGLLARNRRAMAPSGCECFLHPAAGTLLFCIAGAVPPPCNWLSPRGLNPHCVAPASPRPWRWPQRACRPALCGRARTG